MNKSKILDDFEELWNKTENLDQLKHFIHLVVESITCEVNDLRNQPPPFNADTTNPMKHVYQNEGYARALDDLINKWESK